MAPRRVILMSCGSYNPPTNMHLRMFEIARDHLHRMGTHIVVGGVISPVHDAYSKKELASASHRCAMLRLALQSNDWIHLSTWETRQHCWTKTCLCLQYHQNLLNSVLSNSNDIKHYIEDMEWIPENVKNSSDNTPIQIKLLCGADLLESFGICGLWLEEDIDTIVGEHGLIVITREGSNPNKFIYDSDILSKHMHNICIVTEWIPNEVSSTRIRRALKRSESVRYLLQDSVIDYIYKNGIYDTKTSDITTKLELISPNANSYLHIDAKYLNTLLTPSPSDVTMESPSPGEIVSIDVPDAVFRKNLQNTGGQPDSLQEACNQFISAINNVDNGNIRHVAKTAYPGQAKQIIHTETSTSQIKEEVGLVHEPIIKFQTDRLSSNEVIIKDNHKLVIETKPKFAEEKFSDIKSITAITDLVPTDNSQTAKILLNQSSSTQFLLKESYSIVGNIVDNKTKADDKQTISEKDIVDLDVDDINTTIFKEGRKLTVDPINESRILDLDQSSLSKITQEESPYITVEIMTKKKTDLKDREINIKKDTSNAELVSVNARHIVNVQPRRSSYDINIAEKDYRLAIENITKTKTKFNETEDRSEQHAEYFKLSKDSSDLDKFNLQSVIKDDVKIDDGGISSKKETYTFDIASLDGRHECALSDFGIDKEEYWISQYGLNEKKEEEEKTVYERKTGNQIDDMINNIHLISDNQAFVSVICQNDGKKTESSKIDKTENRIDFPEEIDKLNFIEKLSVSSEIDENSKTNVEGEERGGSSEPHMHSLEKQTTSCDSSMEIDGKYLKSIVNSRKSPKKVKEGLIHDSDIKGQNQIINDQTFESKTQSSSSLLTKSLGKIQIDQIYSEHPDVNDKVISNKVPFCKKKILQNFSKSSPTKKSPGKIKKCQNDESDRGFKDRDKAINDKRFKIEKVSQKPLRTFSAKYPKKVAENQIYCKSDKVRNYDKSINDHIISQLKEVFQKNSAKFSMKMENPIKAEKSCTNKIEEKNEHTDNQQIEFEEVLQTPLKISSTKDSKIDQSQKNIDVNDKKAANDMAQQDLIKDVYTRKFRRYNVPLQGSLDSVIVSDESSILSSRKPKKDDALSKKSKSYESIKKIQEVFLGIPSKTNSRSQFVSEQDIPEFCSICCYMNEITFRTEEEVSSPNQETFYTLRSNCSSIADDDSIECDICGSLNPQESTDEFNGKVPMDLTYSEIPCELCSICGEVDGSFDHDEYIFKVAKPNQDNDDRFEIENCGFQSGSEIVDDRSRIPEKEKIKEMNKPIVQSLFIHGSPIIKDQRKELYFIPKDEIAILTSGSKRVSRMGSLLRKKDKPGEHSQDNRRYSSVDNFQLGKMSSKTMDGILKPKNSTLIGSADNLLISRDSENSKYLQRSTDDIGYINSSVNNLDSLMALRKESDIAESINWAQKSSIRDKEAVKMILTQHGIKIISEKETAL